MNAVNEESAQLVKELAEQCRSTSERFISDGDVTRGDKYLSYSEALISMLREVHELRERLMPRVVTEDFGDLGDLPPELRQQLSAYKVDELEQKLHDIAKSTDNELSIDHFLVEMYRRHGDIHERRPLMNKLYRMAQKGMIFAVEGKKGVYVGDAPVHDDPNLESEEIDEFEDIEF